MPLLAAPAAESIWSPCLLEDADLVSASEKSEPPPLQRRPNAASPRTGATTEDEPSLLAWNRAWTFAPPNYLISAKICNPVFPPRAPPGA